MLIYFPCLTIRKVLVLRNMLRYSLLTVGISLICVSLMASVDEKQTTSQTKTATADKDKKAPAPKPKKKQGDEISDERMSTRGLKPPPKTAQDDKSDGKDTSSPKEASKPK